MRRSNAILIAMCISSFLLLLSFQNCSKGFQASDASSLSMQGQSSNLLSEMSSSNFSLLSFQSIPGSAFQQANPLDGLGVAHQAPAYNPYGSIKQKFLAGAEDALALNFKTFKVYMGRAVKTTPQFYEIPAGEMADVNSMVQAADSPSFKKLFSMGFKTFFVEAVAFDLKNRQVMWYPLEASADHPTATNPANDAFTSFDLEREYKETFDLAKYFLQTYRGSGKTFVLQNHEGDHHTFDWSNQNTADPFKPNAMGLENLKKYWSVRQQAVNDAKAQFASDVKVYHMCEVVQVLRSSERGLDSLTRNVLPEVTCDLVGYSAHESAIADGTQSFESALAYIHSKARPSRDFGSNNVIISEIGTLENDSVYATRADQIAKIVSDKLKQGMPYVLYWTLYDNGCVSACAEPVKNEDVIGMWIRKPDGAFGEVYKKIINLLTQKEPNTFVALPSVVSIFRTTLGREPSAEESLSATHRFEMGTASLAQIQSEVAARKRDQDILKIRELSRKYFNAISNDNAAVEKQVAYLAGGASYAQLEAKFVLVKSSWIAESGAPPPEYFWVDRGMNYLINGGTEAQYRAEIKKVLASFPAFFVLRFVNAIFIMEAYITEIILRKRLTQYEKGH